MENNDLFKIKKSSDGGVNLVKYLGDEENIVIPEGIHRIESGAIEGQLKVKSITFPSTLVAVKRGAICIVGENHLEKIITPSLKSWLKITFFGTNPLYYAKNLYIGDNLLTDLFVPANCYVKENAFQYCKSLKTIEFEEGFEYLDDNCFSYTELDKVIFPKSMKYRHRNWTRTSKAFHRAKIKEIIKPSDVNIPLNFFSDCELDNLDISKKAEEADISLKSIKKLDIPANIKKLTISIINSPEEIYIPDTVKYIKYYGAFNGLKKLRLPSEIEFDNNLTFKKIYKAFSNMPDLEYNEYENGLYIGNENNPYVFFVEIADKTAKEVTIHKNTKYIASEAFYADEKDPNDYIALERIIIPKNVKKICYNAFKNCRNLKEVIIENYVDFDYAYGFINNCPNAKIKYFGLTGMDFSFIIKLENNIENISLNFSLAYFNATYESSINYYGTEFKQNYDLRIYLEKDQKRLEFLKILEILNPALENEIKEPQGNYIGIKIGNNEYRYINYDLMYAKLITGFLELPFVFDKNQIKDKLDLSKYKKFDIDKLKLMFEEAVNENNYVEEEKILLTAYSEGWKLC